MPEHTQTICRQKPTNCLIVFDNFVGLALKGLGRVRDDAVGAEMMQLH